jgi:hypothetical protein
MTPMDIVLPSSGPKIKPSNLEANSEHKLALDFFLIVLFGFRNPEDGGSMFPRPGTSFKTYQFIQRHIPEPSLLLIRFSY